MRKFNGINIKRILAVTLSMALTLSGSYAVKADSDTLAESDKKVIETSADFANEEEIDEDSIVLVTDKDSEAEAGKGSGDISAVLENANEALVESNALDADTGIAEDVEILTADEVTNEGANPSGLPNEDEAARNEDMKADFFGSPKICAYLDKYYPKWKTAPATYDEVEIKAKADDPTITKNMVNFNKLSSLTATTLIIDGVDEIRHIYLPNGIKNLIIKNTTLNLREDCGLFSTYSGSMSQANLEKIIFENVTIGNRFDYDYSGRYADTVWSYAKVNKFNISKCENLSELKVDVKFLNDQSVLTFDAGSEYKFNNLTTANCIINNNSSIGRAFVVSKKSDSFFCKEGYSVADAVEFDDKYFEQFLKNRGFDINKDGILTQTELNEVTELTCNVNTIGSVLIDTIYSYKDIEKLTNLENLTIELGRNRNAARINEIAFPDSGHLKNITITNTHTTIKSMIVPSVESFIYTDTYGIEINQATTKPKIEINDTLGKLSSLKIDDSDVTSVTITNGGSKHNLGFSANNCGDLNKIEFVGNGYTLLGNVDLDNCWNLKGIGKNDGGKWIVDGSFGEGNEVSFNANLCKSLCINELVLNYDFAEGKTLSLIAYELGGFNETAANNKLTINRTAGNVKIHCGESDSWITNKYNGQTGFSITAESSTPNILVFPFGNHIIDNAGSGSNTPEQWVERYDIVLRSGSYGPHMDTAKQDTINNFVQNINFYVAEGGTKRRITNIGPDLGISNSKNQTITFTLNGEKGTVQPEIRYTGDGKIYTMYFVGNDNIEFDSTGTLRAKKPGNVNVKAYLGTEVADDKYIGEVNICVRNLAKDVEITNNNPVTGEGTNASNPIYIARDKGKLTFSATFKYDGEIIPNGYDDIYWVFGEPKDGGYSDMACQFATEAVLL